MKATLDRLRRAGWRVAVHNDYRLNGSDHTFWLFTKGDFYAKGEGRTDQEALENVMIEIHRLRPSLNQRSIPMPKLKLTNEESRKCQTDLTAFLNEAWSDGTEEIQHVPLAFRAGFEAAAVYFKKEPHGHA